MARKEWDKDLARRMYDSGATDREIAESTDVTLPTISRWRRSLGLSSNPSRARIQPDKALALYQEGMLDSEIAEKLGVSPSSVGIWRRDQGLTANRNWNKRTALLHYGDGKTDQEIADEMRVPLHAITSWREQLGLDPHGVEKEELASDHAAEEEEEPKSVLTDVILTSEPLPLDSDLPITGAELQEENLDGSEGDETEDEAEPYSFVPRRRFTVLEAALEVFWRQGYMIGELADDLALDEEYVRNWVADQHPGDLDRLDFDTRAAMALLNEGNQDRDIASQLGVAPRHITDWRKRHDLAVESPAYFDEEKATMLFKRGMFDRDIARELGGDVTKADVQAWRLRNNLNLYVDKPRSAPGDKSRSDHYSERPAGRRNTYNSRSNSDTKGYSSRNTGTRSSGASNRSPRPAGDASPRSVSQRPVRKNVRFSAAPETSDAPREIHSAGPKRGRKRNWDVAEAKRLWDMGKSDIEIAQELGTSVNSIRTWRRQANLERPR